MNRSSVLIAIALMSVSTGCTNLAPSATAAIERDKVVLVHGFARSSFAMRVMAESLGEAGYEVHRISYSSLSSTMIEIEQQVQQQIDQCCRVSGTPVHFVGHSLGGLLIRSYLEDNEVRPLGRVVMMGSPNQGTPAVDHYRDSWWFGLLGPAVLSLGTGADSYGAQLRPPNYPLGVIAGSAESAASEHILQGQDDGLVPVESTKVEGMSDFVLLETNHTAMRYDPLVASQVVHFLRFGSFDRGS